MCVKHYVAAKPEAGFPDMTRHAGVAINPGIANVAGVIVHGQASVNHPTLGYPSAVRSDHWQKRNAVVNWVI